MLDLMHAKQYGLVQINFKEEFNIFWVSKMRNQECEHILWNKKSKVLKKCLKIHEKENKKFKTNLMVSQNVFL
jgi:hypothetical protein